MYVYEALDLLITQKTLEIYTLKLENTKEKIPNLIIFFICRMRTDIEERTETIHYFELPRVDNYWISRFFRSFCNKNVYVAEFPRTHLENKICVILCQMYRTQKSKHEIMGQLKWFGI